MSVLKVLTRIAVGVFALGSVSLGALPAHADTISLPDPFRDGSASLTIHKFAASDGLSGVGTGVALRPEDEPAEPLEGATFTLYRVDVPGGGTSTTQGWQEIAALNKQLGNNPDMAQIKAAVGDNNVSEVDSATTNSNGIATFNDLSFALYYVVETEAPQKYFPVAPFLVPLPFTNPDNLNTWIYDAHVYPKDRPGPTKEVLDGDVGAPGQAVTWRISAPVPAGPVSGFLVRDDLTSQLEYKVVAQVTMMDYSKPNPTIKKTFREGTDYRVETSAGSKGGLLVQVVFLQPGLNYLDGINSVSLRVAVDLDTVCLEGGLWENTAEVCDTQAPENGRARDGNGDNNNEVCVFTNTVNTRWGTLNIHKVDSKDKNKGLAGAEFELYYSHDNDFASATQTGNSVVTDASGNATVTPVRFSDWALGEELDPDNEYYWHYWLVETKAPEGYLLATTPIPLTLNAGGAGASGQFNVEITNVLAPGVVTPGEPGPSEPGTGKPTKPGGLAVTGATIAAVLILGGVAFIMGIAAKRRNRDSADA